MENVLEFRSFYKLDSFFLLVFNFLILILASAKKIAKTNIKNKNIFE